MYSETTNFSVTTMIIIGMPLNKNVILQNYGVYINLSNVTIKFDIHTSKIRFLKEFRVL